MEHGDTGALELDVYKGSLKFSTSHVIQEAVFAFNNKRAQTRNSAFMMRMQLVIIDNKRDLIYTRQGPLLRVYVPSKLVRGLPAGVPFIF